MLQNIPKKTLIIFLVLLVIIISVASLTLFFPKEATCEMVTKIQKCDFMTKEEESLLKELNENAFQKMDDYKDVDWQEARGKTVDEYSKEYNKPSFNEREFFKSRESFIVFSNRRIKYNNNCYTIYLPAPAGQGFLNRVDCKNYSNVEVPLYNKKGEEARFMTKSEIRVNEK